MNPDTSDPPRPRIALPRDEQRIITLGMMGFVYLSFLTGAGMILFGNVERVNDSRINLIIVGPLLVALGYITGRRGTNTDTGGGPNINQQETVVLPPAEKPDPQDPSPQP